MPYFYKIMNLLNFLSYYIYNFRKLKGKLYKHLKFWKIVQSSPKLEQIVTESPCNLIFSHLSTTKTSIINLNQIKENEISKCFL